MPAYLRDRIYAFNRKSKIAKARERKARTVVGVRQVEECLRKIRFSGDILMHSSVSNFGRFDCTVPELVDCILGVLDTKARTVLVPALPFASSTKEYLDRCEGFDVRSAPNAMGSIANIVMRSSGALRSIHPTHSVAALGPSAVCYISDHHKEKTPFGRLSPFFRLQQERGHILLFGVGLGSLTSNHVYEDMLGSMLPFQIYLDSEYKVRCIDTHGGVLEVVTLCHSPIQTARCDPERARAFLLARGRIQSYPLGEAEIAVVNARDLTVTLLEMLAEGKSIYGKVRLSGSQRDAVETCLFELK